MAKRFAPQSVDDVEPEVRLRRNVIVDDIDAVSIDATTGAGMADDQGTAEKRLDPVIVEVDAQTLADQL